MSSRPRSRSEICRRDFLVRTVHGVAVVGTPWIAGCGPTELNGPDALSENLGQSPEESSASPDLRLTLRVLLAYRDRILEQTDMEDIARGLAGSAFAREVNSRIDTVTKAHVDHLAIAEGQHMPDANHVAEYLDNVLDSADVKEFEGLCLQSDAALAEVASCHHIQASLLQMEGDPDPMQHGRLRDRVKNVLTQ
jgi:hypothetical protein